MMCFYLHTVLFVYLNHFVQVWHKKNAGEKLCLKAFGVHVMSLFLNMGHNIDNTSSSCTSSYDFSCSLTLLQCGGLQKMNTDCSDFLNV